MNDLERDPLTGLANRRGFNRAVRALIDAHPDKRFTLIYGDVDRFKVFNDRFGTEAGDRLLAEAGAKIASVLPACSVAARLRADHFVCCVPRDTCQPERALEVLDEWLEDYPVDFSFFVRLGVYEVDDPTLDVSLMTDRALLALREAKTGGQASRFASFDESMRDTVVKEQELAGEMAAALEDGQFELYFQPQYRFATGQLAGAEVLARWNHPEKGLIGPAEFIPVFERTGLISTFDYYIWDKACHCLRAWLDDAGPGNEGRVPRLSVNLSRSDVYRADLCDYLVGLVEKYRIPQHMLHLEVTESSYREEPEQLAQAVRGLQQAGFIVEMDDFGSGYSSLNALKDVPVDVLKLDLRFLDARNDTRGGVILASIVRMARWLDLPVIAEGVESRSQALFLSSVGCDVMQGFWFSHPLSRIEFERIVSSSTCEAAARRRAPGASSEYAQLWDAESVAALVFNSYLGPAALAEYDGARLEVIRSNDEFLNLLGLPIDQFPRTVDDVFGTLDEDDREGLVDTLARATGTAGVGECELCVRGRGPAFWVHVRARRVSQVGTVSSLLIMLDETTEKQALRDRLHAVMEGVPGGLGFYQVQDGCVTLLDFNDASADMVGMTRDEYAEACAVNALAPVAAEDRWIVSVGIDELLGGARRADNVIRTMHADGSLRWLSMSASLMYRSDEAMYVVVVFLDITEGKEKELLYRRQAEQQAHLYESVPCGIVRFFVGESPRIESANRAACAIAGCASYFELLDYLGDDVFLPFDEEGRADLLRVIDRLLAGSDPVTYSLRLCRADGGEAWIEGSSALSETLDGEAIVQCAFTDVTEQRLRSQRRELERFTSVLCSAYDEIFEYDTANNTYLLCYSAHVAVDNTQPIPVDQAFERWFVRIPEEADRNRLRELADFCRTDAFQQPVSHVYRCDFDGRTVWCESTFMRVSECSVLCCNNDVTDRMEAEQRKRSWQNERYRILSELTHAISFDYDSQEDAVIFYIDRTGAGMEKQVIPNYLKTLSDQRVGVLHPDSLESVRTLFERARAGGKTDAIEYRADYYGTGYQWYRTNLLVAHDQRGAWHLVGVIDNIQTERDLRVKAEHDAITGLLNNAAMRSLVADALADPHVRARSVCAVIDLDDFKSVNDTCGHLKGDELLQMIGSVLRSHCRESDVVGRVGGDEFVLLLKNVGLEVAARKLADMKRAIGDLTLVGDGEVPGRPLRASVSVSMGATATRPEDTSYEDVFARADKALYAAKRAGKNRLRISS